MRFKTLLLTLLLLLPVLAFAGSRVETGRPFADPDPDGQADLKARILFTSNALGEFEPCACADLPLGGVGQVAGLVEAVRAAGSPTFWFDAGDRLFRLDMAMTGTEEAERRLRAILLVDAGSVGGLDAMGIGRLDLGGGLGYLQSLRIRAAFPMVSANLVDDSGAPLFEPSVLVERDGRVIGVTSVLPADVSGEGFTTVDPYAAARAEVASLRERGAQIVIVLSNLGMKADTKLARRSKADVVLGSHSRELTTEGVRVGRAVIGQAGTRGRYLGDLRWYGEGPGKGPHLVVTTMPVHATGAVDPAVAGLVEVVLERLADPVLGVPPVRFDGWDDPDYRERLRK